LHGVLAKASELLARLSFHATLLNFPFKVVSLLPAITVKRSFYDQKISSQSSRDFFPIDFYAFIGSLNCSNKQMEGERKRNAIKQLNDDEAKDTSMLPVANNY